MPLWLMVYRRRSTRHTYAYEGVEEQGRGETAGSFLDQFTSMSLTSEWSVKWVYFWVAHLHVLVHRTIPFLVEHICLIRQRSYSYPSERRGAYGAAHC
jgi:hypothetical protein